MGVVLYRTLARQESLRRAAARANTERLSWGIQLFVARVIGPGGLITRLSGQQADKPRAPASVFAPLWRTDLMARRLPRPIRAADLATTPTDEHSARLRESPERVDRFPIVVSVNDIRRRWNVLEALRDGNARRQQLRAERTTRASEDADIVATPCQTQREIARDDLSARVAAQRQVGEEDAPGHCVWSFARAVSAKASGRIWRS